MFIYVFSFQLFTDLTQNYFVNNRNYDIYLVERPLFCPYVNTLMTALNIKHPALLFVDKVNGTQFLIQYDLKPGTSFNINSILKPKATFNWMTMTYKFDWAQTMTVFIDSLQTTSGCEWSQGDKIAVDADGTILNSWVYSYALQYQQGEKVYQALELIYPDDFSEYDGIQSTQSADFVFDGIYALHGMNVHFQNSVVDRIKGFYVLDKRYPAPKQLNPNKPYDSWLIYNYYYSTEDLELAYTDVQVLQMLLTKQFSQSIPLTFVVYVQNSYWYFTTAISPAIWYQNFPVQLPQ